MIGGEPLTTKRQTRKHKPTSACHADQVSKLCCRLTEEPLDMKIRRGLLLLSAVAVLAALPVAVKSQSLSYTGEVSGTVPVATSRQLGPPYVRPTERTMASNYIFDAYGPYPIAGSAFAAGINQFSDEPPEWGQGAEGYGKRFGSDFAIAAVGTTTRYGLAEALTEDTLYYRCQCSGFFPRLRHAVISSVTARRGEDGHLVFSLPAFVAPYAGSMTAVYGWYPNRFSAKDGFRIGNYGLLAYVGQNISLEFFYSGPHSLLSRMHLNNKHGSPVQGSNQ